MNLIDLPQGGRMPSSLSPKKPLIVKAGSPPVKMVYTPTPAKKSQLTNPEKTKPKQGNLIDIIINGVLPIATNPVIPGTGGITLLPKTPGQVTTPISPNVPVLGNIPPVLGGIADTIGDIKLPSLPAFPDLGLPNIGKWFDDLKSGAGLVLLGIGGLIALLIITRK